MWAHKIIIILQNTLAIENANVNKFTKRVPTELQKFVF